jgi:hypothetical protein
MSNQNIRIKFNASTVLSVGLITSINLTYVLNSYWSLAFLLTCGEVNTVKRSFRLKGNLVTERANIIV